MGMQDALPWIMAGLGAAGFVITWNRIVVSVTRAIDAIKTDTTDTINEETKKLTKNFSHEVGKVTSELARLSEKFEEDQRTQDNRFGEIAMSLRQKVADVEKEMHKIEIWGRDNYVQKPEFKEDLQRIETAINALSHDVRSDIRALMGKNAEDQ